MSDAPERPISGRCRPVTVTFDGETIGSSSSTSLNQTWTGSTSDLYFALPGRAAEQARRGRPRRLERAATAISIPDLAADGSGDVSGSVLAFPRSGSVRRRTRSDFQLADLL